MARDLARNQTISKERTMDVTAFKLPLSFDTQRLYEDLTRMTGDNWLTHFKTMHYSGDWSSLALIAVGGDPTDIRSTEGDFRPTEILERSPYFQEVIGAFRCPFRKVRLLRLAPGALIREHVDREGLDTGIARIHIPIVTNDKVEFFLAGRRLVMKPGECWLLNTSYPHRVANPSNEARVHLVLDCELNDFITDMLGVDLSKGRWLRVIEHSIQQCRFRVIDLLRLVRLAFLEREKFTKWLLRQVD